MHGGFGPRRVCTPEQAASNPVSKANFTTALEAEAAFYQALAQGDIDALMAVWSEDEEVVCVHPGGPRIVGLAAVRDTWRQILSGGSTLKIDVSQAVVSASAMMAMHCVFERVAGEGSLQSGPTLAATNVYVRGPNGWRMVLHHASPIPEQADFGDLSPRVVH